MVTGISGGRDISRDGLTTNLPQTLEQLAALIPTTLAMMQGSSFTGDGAGQLRRLSDGYVVLAGAQS